MFTIYFRNCGCHPPDSGRHTCAKAARRTRLGLERQPEDLVRLEGHAALLALVAGETEGGEERVHRVDLAVTGEVDAPVVPDVRRHPAVGGPLPGHHVDLGEVELQVPYLELREGKGEGGIAEVGVADGEDLCPLLVSGDRRL